MREPSLKKIKIIFNHQQIYTIFNKEGLRMIKETVDLIEKQIKRDEPSTKEKNEKVIETINLLINLAIQKTITPIFRDLTNEFIVLTIFWNEKIAQNSEIQRKIYSLRNFIDYHLSVIETIQELKSLLEKMKELQSFNPPAFDLSKHYLSYLQKEKKKKNT